MPKSKKGTMHLVGRLKSSGKRGKGKGSSKGGILPNAAIQTSMSNTVVERGIPGFRAMKYRCRLNYSDFQLLTTGAGSATNYVYSANGVYDPDITGTGHQPMAFDQMILSFEHYCVVNARITVTARNFSSVYPANISISLNASTTVISDYVRLVENGLITRAKLGITSVANSVATISHSIGIAKFGSVRDLLDNPDYAGTAAANPAEQSYFHISAWNTESVTAIVVACDIFIEYDTWFFEPRKLTISTSGALLRLIRAEARESKS